MEKTYVVFVGRRPGVYDTWEQASVQVNGFSNNLHRSFPTREAAVAAFLESQKDHHGSSSYSSSGCEKKTKEADTSSSIGHGGSSVEQPNEERDRTLQERDQAVQERDQAVQERDQALKELAELRAKIRSLAFE